MGTGVTPRDWLLVVAIIAIGGAIVGAFTGFYGERFAFTGGVRAVIFAAYAGLAGSFARSFVMRRAKARSMQPPARG